jgi:hypothetical protein
MVEGREFKEIENSLPPDDRKILSLLDLERLFPYIEHHKSTLL